MVESVGGGGGGERLGVLEQCQAAVQQHLHQGTYQQQEIEEALGTSLQQLFADNPSYLRWAAPPCWSESLVGWPAKAYFPYFR